MLKKILKKHFGIEAEEATPLRKFLTCKKNDQRFLLVPIFSSDEEELEELGKIATYLEQSGDRSICTFINTNDNSRVVEWESKKYCVLKCQPLQVQRNNRMGRKLAKFHYRGRTLNFPIKKLNRIGQWKNLWEKRLDQMEKVWRGMLIQEPENEFDRMFLESFPYYMAIGENAIQYLVDTELDDDPTGIDSGTVCHKRFTNGTWGNDILFKNPFDWVFDHCSRDIAEWTRERYWYNTRTYQPELQQFFTDYQSVEKLGSFTWRLAYARILFPLHYIDCVEDYYSTTSDQKRRFLTERLEKYLYASREYEKFLKHFYPIAEVPVQTLRIPVIQWL